MHWHLSLKPVAAGGRQHSALCTKDSWVNRGTRGSARCTRGQPSAWLALGGCEVWALEVDIPNLGNPLVAEVPIWMNQGRELLMPVSVPIGLLMREGFAGPCCHTMDSVNAEAGPESQTELTYGF